MRVRIETPQNGVGWGTKVLNEDGSEIGGITNITIRIVPDDIIKAELEVGMLDLRGVGAVEAEFVGGPDMKPIRRIEYMDGTEDVFGAGD